MAIVLLTLPEDIVQGLKQLATLFNTDQVLEFLGGMLEEAQRAPIAERFSAERVVGAGLTTTTAGLSYRKNPFLQGTLTEERYKREQLAIAITTIRSDFTRLFGQAEAVFLDLRVSQLD